MEIILLKDVEKVGLRGEVVTVARGYARNYLLPRKLAEVATPGRVAEVKRIHAERARHEARSADQAAEVAATLGKTVLRFDVKSGPTGSLFGSVTSTDIADEIWRTRKIRVDRRKIGVDSIKRIGRYAIAVDVFDGVTAELKLLVVPEGGELPPEEELAAMEAAEEAARAKAAGLAEAPAVEALPGPAAPGAERGPDGGPFEAAPGEAAPGEASEASDAEGTQPAPAERLDDEEPA